MNLVLLERDEVDASGHVTLSGTRATHLIEVVKVARGRSVRIGLIEGPFGTGTVTSTGDRTLTMSCVFETATPPPPGVDLLLALPRPKVMRRLWAQLAALGVGRIMLTNAARVERCYFDSHILDITGYRPLLIEGLQQARDTRLPIVSVHRQLRILVEDQLDGLCPDAARLVADPEASRELHTAVREQPPSRVLLAVGPEGGWNDFERTLLQRQRFTAVTMGSRTLRTDTACVALLTLVHCALAQSPGPDQAP